MKTPSPALPLSLAAKLGLLGTAALVGLPILGLGLAWAYPVGLIDAPPIHTDRLVEATSNTVLLALLVTVFAVVLGSFFAWIQVRWIFPGSSLLTRLTVLPLVLPSFLLAATLREGLAPLGSLGELLGRQERFDGFGATVFVLVLSCTPYVQLVVSAALKRLPRHTEEAAQSLGASPIRIVREIVLPALRPALGFAALLVLVYAAADFGAVAVMDTQVLTYELYQFAGRGGVQAPLIGGLLIVAISPLVILGRRLGGDYGSSELSYVRSGHMAGRRPALWVKIIGTALLGIYLIFGLVLPLMLITRWGLLIPAQGPLIGPLVTTAVVGVTAGLATLVLGGFPAALVAKSKGKRGALETLTFVASGVPGVMIGFGLLQLALRVPQGSLRSFVEGGAILLLGLALRFASHSYAALKPALLTQNQQSVEAARLLGASRWRVWHRVRGPHLAPALASGFLLSFVAVVKELPITLMLIPAGHTTLATRIFDAHEDAHLGDLGVAALSLLGMVLVAQALLWRWSRHER